MKKKIFIAPSILSADFAQLGAAVGAVEKAGAEWLHIDVMDGHFVPNLTIGPAVVKSLRKRSKLLFDVHLMITRPDLYWRSFLKAGANLITFHVESKARPLALIKEMKHAGLRVGISVRPGTSVDKIFPFLPFVDMVLIMTVEPGFGGQAFMNEMVEKIKKIREIIKRKKLPCCLQVDGGISLETASIAVRAGADVLVAGQSVFGAEDPAKAVRSLRRVIDKCR